MSKIQKHPIPIKLLAAHAYLRECEETLSDILRSFKSHKKNSDNIKCILQHVVEGVHNIDAAYRHLERTSASCKKPMVDFY